MKTYKIIYQESGTLKHTIIESENIQNENLPFNVISVNEIKKVKNSIFKKRVTNGEVLALFSELNIMLQANVLLNDAVKILYKNTKNEELKEILFTLLSALENGKQLDEQLKSYKNVLGELPLIFLKIAQENGNLKTVMNSLVVILQNRKQIKDTIFNSLRYPIVLSLSLFGLILFSFYFIIPKFEHLFLQYNSNLPLSTQMLLNLKVFIHSYFIYFLCALIIGIVAIKIQYTINKKFRYKIDKFLILHVPLLNRVIFYTNFQLFFLSITILLNDKYKFQTAFVNAQIVIKNLFLSNSLTNINQQIQSGKSISFAFENSKLFDDLVLRLISIGEQSNSLPITINECEKIYKKRVEDSFKKFVIYIEPLFLILISSFIVWLMLAIFMPIWNLNDAMNM